MWRCGVRRPMGRLHGGLSVLTPSRGPTYLESARAVFSEGRGNVLTERTQSERVVVCKQQRHCCFNRIAMVWISVRALPRLASYSTLHCAVEILDRVCSRCEEPKGFNVSFQLINLVNKTAQCE